MNSSLVGKLLLVLLVVCCCAARPGMERVPTAGMRRMSSVRDMGVVLQSASSGLAYPVAEYDRSGFHLFYEMPDSDDPRCRLAISADGVSWTRQGLVNLSATFFAGHWHLDYSDQFAPLIASPDQIGGAWMRRAHGPSFLPNDLIAAGEPISEHAQAQSAVRNNGRWLLFLTDAGRIEMGRAVTADDPWQISAERILPASEILTWADVWHDEQSSRWFLFTVHGADAIWIYWTTDPMRWNPKHKAIVADRTNTRCLFFGRPAVVEAKDRLFLFYERRDSSEERRKIGLVTFPISSLP
jgi:hypothetical protein